MDQYQLKKKIEEVKEKFEKYDPPASSPLYERVVEDLAKGANPYFMIMGLLSVIQQESSIPPMIALTMYQVDWTLKNI